MEWLDPWYPTSESEEMTSELVREVIKGHPLFGVSTKTIGRRQDNDDVLFRIEDGSERVAVVHLTWSMKPERDAGRPHTVLYESLAIWSKEVMRNDHDQLT